MRPYIYRFWTNNFLMSAIGSFGSVLIFAVVMFDGGPVTAAVLGGLLLTLGFLGVAWFFDDMDRMVKGSKPLHREFLEWEDRHDVLFHLRTMFLGSLAVMLIYGLIWSALPVSLKAGAHEVFVVFRDVGAISGILFFLNIALAWIADGPLFDGVRYLRFRFR